MKDTPTERIELEEDFDDLREVDDDVALLQGAPVHRSPRKPMVKQWLVCALATVATVLAMTMTAAAFFYLFQLDTTLPPRPKNIIFMISDGFGPASETYARSYYQFIHNLTYNHPMPLDKMLVGQSRTRSASSYVTDSAAGATAFSCGIKTYNGGVGVDPQERLPCGTVLESAKIHRQMHTGLVATSRITHATPAAFSAHVVDRDMEDAIAEQQIGLYPLGRMVDVMFGGGYCHFMPQSASGSCRRDDVDVFAEAEQMGWSVGHSKADFDAIQAGTTQLPAMALFTPDHMSYDIDRDPAVEPSLKEMSEKALQLLNHASEESGHGFFLMIEGSRIDMAGHSNDPGSHLLDILAYQETIDLVQTYVDIHPDTILVSTSDHETGGLSLANQAPGAKGSPEYLWYPNVLTRCHNSTIKLAESIALGDDTHHYLIGNTNVTRADYLTTAIFKNGLGITDPTSAELAWFTPSRSTSAMDKYLAQMISDRAHIGWTTHGHTGVDVNLYAYPPTHPAVQTHLTGSHENTDISQFFSTLLSLDIDAVTAQLVSNSSFVGKSGKLEKRRFWEGIKRLSEDHPDHTCH